MPTKAKSLLRFRAEIHRITRTTTEPEKFKSLCAKMISRMIECQTLSL